MYYNFASIDEFLAMARNEFLGLSPILEIQARKEYMYIKCLSFKRKHFQFHYVDTLKRYY